MYITNIKDNINKLLFMFLINYTQLLLFVNYVFDIRHNLRDLINILTLASCVTTSMS